MVIFTRGREIVAIFAMRDPWLASKRTELPPKAIRVLKKVWRRSFMEVPSPPEAWAAGVRAQLRLYGK